MALLEDLTKDASPTGLMTGIGAVLLAPILAPAVTRVLRPAAKGILSTGITLYRGVMEPVGSAFGSLVAEAQLELATARAGMEQDTAVAEGAGTPDAGAHEPEHHKRRSRSKRAR